MKHPLFAQLVSLTLAFATVDSVLAQQAVADSITSLPKPRPGYEWVLVVQEDGSRVPQQVPVVNASVVAKKSPAQSPTASSQTSGPKPAASSASSAAGGLSDALTKKVDSINVDRPLGAAAAFVALDVSPETVTQPSSPRELAAALLNGVDHNGTLQTGLAVEAAPFQIFHHGNYNINDYNSPTLSGITTRILYNSSVSIATTKASTNDDKSERLSLGFHFSLYDSSDPKASPEIKAIADDAWNQFPTPIPNVHASYEQNAANDAAIQTAAGKFIDDRIAEWRKEHWAQKAWDLAWAPIWQTPDSNVSNLRYDGSLAYSTFAYGLDKDPLGGDGRLQLITQARFREGEQVMASTGNGSGRQDTFTFGGRIRYGSVDLNGSAEVAYVRIWNGPLGNGDRVRYGGGLEKKISTNLWLTLNFGEDTGGGSKRPNDLFALGGLRFGTADKAQFAQ
jgi:hypothetical protein